MFKIGSSILCDMFYIILKYDNGVEIVNDKDIAEWINITCGEYIEILKNHNGHIMGSGECYFEIKEDCVACCQYLEETYGIIIKLME